MRITKQRTKILEIVKSSKDHPNAAEIYDIAKKEQPNISMGTVYRNLNVLSEKGFINKVLLSEDALRFDGDLCEHHHMICVGCGKLYDVFPGDFIVPTAFYNTGAKVLKYSIMAECICSKCQEQESGAASL